MLEHSVKLVIGIHPDILYYIILHAILIPT
jgi:hypothetical protein